MDCWKYCTQVVSLALIHAALGFTSCCIRLSTCPSCAKFRPCPLIYLNVRSSPVLACSAEAHCMHCDASHLFLSTSSCWLVYSYFLNCSMIESSQGVLIWVSSIYSILYFVRAGGVGGWGGRGARAPWAPPLVCHWVLHGWPPTSTSYYASVSGWCNYSSTHT